MAAEVGKYFFRKRYSVFYIYQYDVVEDGMNLQSISAAFRLTMKQLRKSIV